MQPNFYKVRVIALSIDAFISLIVSTPILILMLWKIALQYMKVRKINYERCMGSKNGK